MNSKVCHNVFIVFIVVVLLNVTIGCDRSREPASVSPGALALVESDRPLFSTDFPSGRLDIQAVAIDSLDKTVTLTLTQDAGGISNNRLLSIQFYETDSNAVGVRHILTDRAGGLLWAFDYAVDTTDENHWWFTERTLFDEMTVAHWSGPGFTEETYTINGDSRTFPVHTSDVEKLRSLHDAVRSGDSLTGLSIEDAEIVATLRAFDEFYVSDNTLHNTEDGTLLFEVLTNDALAGWLITEYVGGDDQPLYRPGWADWLCAAGVVCAVYKCPAGGFSNPVCAACTAIFVTCIIMDTLDLW